MCGNYIETKDGRRKFCDGCRDARKHLFDRNAAQAFRRRARQRRLAEQEELDGLRTENEILREQVKNLKAILRGSYEKTETEESEQW